MQRCEVNISFHCLGLQNFIRKSFEKKITIPVGCLFPLTYFKGTKHLFIQWAASSLRLCSRTQRIYSPSKLSSLEVSESGQGQMWHFLSHRHLHIVCEFAKAAPRQECSPWHQAQTQTKFCPHNCSFYVPLSHGQELRVTVTSGSQDSGSQDSGSLRSPACLLQQLVKEGTFPGPRCNSVLLTSSQLSHSSESESESIVSPSAISTSLTRLLKPKFPKKRVQIKPSSSQSSPLHTQGDDEKGRTVTCKYDSRVRHYMWIYIILRFQDPPQLQRPSTHTKRIWMLPQRPATLSYSHPHVSKSVMLLCKDPRIKRHPAHLSVHISMIFTTMCRGNTGYAWVIILPPQAFYKISQNFMQGVGRWLSTLNCESKSHVFDRHILPLDRSLCTGHLTPVYLSTSTCNPSIVLYHQAVKNKHVSEWKLHRKSTNDKFLVSSSTFWLQIGWCLLLRNMHHSCSSSQEKVHNTCTIVLLLAWIVAAAHYASSCTHWYSSVTNSILIQIPHDSDTRRPFHFCFLAWQVSAPCTFWLNIVSQIVSWKYAPVPPFGQIPLCPSWRLVHQKFSTASSHTSSTQFTISDRSRPPSV